VLGGAAAKHPAFRERFGCANGRRDPAQRTGGLILIAGDITSQPVTLPHRTWLALYATVAALYLLTSTGRLGGSDALAMFNVAQSLATKGSISADPCTPELRSNHCVPGAEGRNYAGFGLVPSIVAVPAYAAGQVAASLLHADVHILAGLGIRSIMRFGPRPSPWCWVSGWQGLACLIRLSYGAPLFMASPRQPGTLATTFLLSPISPSGSWDAATCWVATMDASRWPQPALASDLPSDRESMD